VPAAAAGKVSKRADNGGREEKTTVGKTTPKKEGNKLLDIEIISFCWLMLSKACDDQFFVNDLTDVFHAAGSL